VQRLLAFCFASGCICITACQPASDAATGALAASAASQPTQPQGRLQRLAGTWVGQRKDGFDLLKIPNDSTGFYTRFTDRKQWRNAVADTLRYGLYEAPVRVEYSPNSRPHPKVAIYTGYFRFDYNLVADTLIEVDKMGLQGKLFRVRSTRYLPVQPAFEDADFLAAY
jgi:hypothetical protein